MGTRVDEKHRKARKLSSRIARKNFAHFEISLQTVIVQLYTGLYKKNRGDKYRPFTDDRCKLNIKTLIISIEIIKSKKKWRAVTIIDTVAQSVRFLHSEQKSRVSTYFEFFSDYTLKHVLH